MDKINQLALELFKLRMSGYWSGEDMGGNKARMMLADPVIPEWFNECKKMAKIVFKTAQE